MYYNIISSEKTVFPYRFKTKQEFFETFGGDWWEEISGGWNYEMNNFFGKDLEIDDLEYIQNIFKYNGSNGWIHRYKNHFVISKDMVIRNKQNSYSEFYKHNRLVYERFNSLNDSSEIYIRMYDIEDYEYLNNVMEDITGLYNPIIPHEDDVRYGSPAYIYISLSNYNVTSSCYNVGLIHNIENGGLLIKPAFDGIYEKIYDIKKHKSLITDVLKYKKIIYPNSFINTYKNWKKNIY